VLIRSLIRIPDHVCTSLAIEEHEILRTFISISHAATDRFHETRRNDADKIMNPQHYESDPADIRIRIRINPEIWIRISDHYLLVEVRRLGGGLRSLSTVHTLCPKK